MDNETQNLIIMLKIKMSKYKIAKKMGVSWNTIHMWERGVFQATNDKLKKLKELFNEKNM